MIAALAIGPAANADVDDCNREIDGYNNTVNEIASYLRRYANCVSGSRGQDDCSTEFRRLRNAQMDFESAVSNIRTWCD